MDLYFQKNSVLKQIVNDTHRHAVMHDAEENRRNSAEMAEIRSNFKSMYLK